MGMNRNYSDLEFVPQAVALFPQELRYLIAHGSGKTVESITDESAWSRLKEFNHER